MTQIDNAAEMIGVSTYAGKKWGEEALEAQQRLGELMPRYRWKRTQEMFDPDFSGFDGPTLFGRIWLDETLGSKERWQWSCTVTMSHILNSPANGGADIARQAARDLEDHYDALKRLNGATGE